MKQIALATLLCFTAAIAAPATAVAQGQSQKATSLAIPVAGKGANGTFSGTFKLQRFANQNGQVVATGLLTGVVTNTVTGETGSVVRSLTLPATVGGQATNGVNASAITALATCDILHLDLGPLNLDLLGLNIDLSRIVLDITAQSGAGNLLGNLLCAVAGLLDSPGPLANLLNQILGILAGL